MHYRVSVVIDQPRYRVAQLLQDPDALPHWQKGFVSITPQQGEPGAPGSTAMLAYQMGKRELSMLETMESTDWPAGWIATYEADGVWNRQVNRLIEQAGQTRWESDCEFRFSSLPMRCMGWLMPWAFRKQTRSYLLDFKHYAETGEAVRP